jgi:hypothetical protein
MSRLIALPMRVAVMTAVVASVAVGQPALEPPSPPIIELRLASDKLAPGFDVRRDIGHGEQPNVFFLAPDPVVSDADVVRARARRAPDGLVVELEVSDAAAARLRETTATHVGRYLAVLANGRLAAASSIMQSVPTRNTMNVGLSLPPAAADSVRSRVAARWPRSGR